MYVRVGEVKDGSTPPRRLYIILILSQGSGARLQPLELTGDWPYKGSVLSDDATVQIVLGKLLVFGGTSLGIFNHGAGFEDEEVVEVVRVCDEA